MLHKLPLEIVLTISNLLTLKDKLILITTCRHLFNLISKTSLYSELDLFNHTEQVEEIIGKFTDSRYPGTQVKRLKIDITKLSHQILPQLPIIFPNITQVTTLKQKLYYNDAVQFQDDCFLNSPMIHWSKTLEVYNMQSDWPEAAPVLTTTTFPRLKKLQLGNAIKFADTIKGCDIRFFQPIFKNVPSLKNLTLTNCSVDLKLLEEIHGCCPQLESLELDTTTIIIRDDALIQPIIPANSLLYLDLTNLYCFDTNGLFLDYIASKYRCLKELYLNFNDTEDDISKSNRLFNDLNSDDVSENGVDDLDSMEIQENRPLTKEYVITLSVYKESGIRFFSNLTTSIEILTIEEDIFGNTIEALSNSDTKLRTLNYYSTLENQDQMQYLRNINYLKELYIAVNFPEQINLQTFPSNSITNLSFYNCGKPIYFDWLLSTFPLLEKVEIHGGHYWSISNNSYTNTFPKLQSLWARVESIDQACIDFLIKTAPNINSLILFSSNHSPAMSDITIDISKWKLTELCLASSDMACENSYYYNIKSPYLDEIVKYVNKEKSVALVKDRVKAFVDGKPPMVNIISDDNVYFNFYDCKVSLTQQIVTLISSNQ